MELWKKGTLEDENFAKMKLWKNGNLEKWRPGKNGNYPKKLREIRN